MKSSDVQSHGNPSSRRDFLKTSTVAVGGALAAQLAIGRSAHAAGDDTIKIGLIGCGGRGTGAAMDALQADKNVKLIAMGDAFADRLQNSRAQLQKAAVENNVQDKLAVSDDHCFVGFDAYQKVINSGVDVVLLTTPPHFRPAHLAAAIEAGKHVFCEKPVAVDAPGVRSVLASCEKAKEKGLSVVSGLCYRYHQPKRETIARIHDGAIGDVLALHVTYNTGTLWNHPRQPSWSDMENQMRNWLYYHWLSGDHIVEQHIHSLDKAAWVMKDEPPVQCTAMGGRLVRTGEEFGNAYDHFSCVFEYAGGVKLFASCRQMAGCSIDVNDHIIGSKGSAQLMKATIETKDDKWKYRGKDANMYQQEHDELFASIRSGKPINNGLFMSRSTMLAILGRMSAYTGQTLTWEKAFNSKEDLSPPKYEWTSLPVAPVAKPGVTQFV